MMSTLVVSCLIMSATIVGLSVPVAAQIHVPPQKNPSGPVVAAQPPACAIDFSSSAAIQKSINQAGPK